LTSPLPVDARATVKREFEKLRPRIKPNSSIAIAVGSRGITDIRGIVETVVEEIKRLGAKPLIIPAMGSHGGATAEGQREILAEYGISEQTLNVPVRPAMDVQALGTTTEGRGGSLEYRSFGRRRSDRYQSHQTAHGFPK
jgi:hypothetical protein